MDLKDCKDLYLKEGLEGLRNKYRKIKEDEKVENRGIAYYTSLMHDKQLITKFGKDIKRIETNANVKGQVAIRQYNALRGIY